MPTEQLTGIQSSCRHLVSVTSVYEYFRQVNPQDFRYLHCSRWSRCIVTLCWNLDVSNRTILLASYNQNGFLVTIYYNKRDLEARKCIETASGPEESILLHVCFNCGGRTLKCGTEFVLRSCETPNTRTIHTGLSYLIYLVTVIDSFPKLKCVTQDLGTFSDVWALWLNSSYHAVALLENSNATVCVVRGGLLLVLQFETVTLDPSNFSLFSFRPPAMDLTTAYRYNQNMMEYYTCKSKS
jgi:hypothetical protein